MEKNYKTKAIIVAKFIALGATFISSGLLYEKLAKTQYQNIETNQYETFRSSIGYYLVLRLIIWLLAEIYFRKTILKTQRVVIDKKRLLICGLIMTIASVGFIEGIYLLSFPFIMMVKSTNVLQSVLSLLFGSEKKIEMLSKHNKLGNSFIIFIGLFIYTIFDSEKLFQSQGLRQIELLGILIILINLCASSFLTDFKR